MSFRGERIYIPQMVIGYHIILTGYGHWLANDPRGSYSRALFSPELAPLAEMHFGRRRIQPSREQLRAFYVEAQKRLRHPVLWWAAAEQQALAGAFGEVITAEGLTCYACAVLSNHVHFLMRKHRLKAEEMSEPLKEAALSAVRDMKSFSPGHPVFSGRSCHIYKSDTRAMWACVDYIESNFAKHRLPRERYGFVTPYDNWPDRKKSH